jgi:hypothetical protein
MLSATPRRTEVFSESPPTRRSADIRTGDCPCSRLRKLRPGSTPAPQPSSRNVPAGARHPNLTLLHNRDHLRAAGLPPASSENRSCSLPGMLLPGSTPAPQSPSRNVPAGLNTYTSLFLTLRSSPGRRSSAGCIGELFLDPLYFAEPTRNRGGTDAKVIASRRVCNLSHP